MVLPFLTLGGHDAGRFLVVVLLLVLLGLEGFPALRGRLLWGDLLFGADLLLGSGPLPGARASLGAPVIPGAVTRLPELDSRVDGGEVLVPLVA